MKWDQDIAGGQLAAKRQLVSWPRTILNALGFVFLGFWAPLHPASAENFALLVGVNTYPALSQGRQLKGPENDVIAVRDFLLRHGVLPQNVSLLSTQKTSDAQAPTRAAILKFLDQLVERANPQAFVFIYFAGHGAQQPAKATRDEPDGLDEIFLPTDSDRWQDGLSAVENAITDTEIGERVSAMRRRGAFVWAVFDTCHAGTMLRAGAGAERARAVSMRELGIPEPAIEFAHRDAANRAEGRAGQTSPVFTEQGDAPGTDTSMGAYVAFYAAQSSELASEMSLPPGERDSKPRGFFTYTLVQSLESNPAATYRQIAQQIIYRFRAANRTATPLFEGNGLDARLLKRTGDAVRQWTVQQAGGGYVIPAGLLHGVDQGTILALVPDAVSRLDDAIGYAEIMEAKASQSRIASIDYHGLKASAGDLRPGLFARAVDVRFERSLRLAMPALQPTSSASDADRVLQAVEELRRTASRDLQVHTVESDQTADLKLLVHGGRLWFVAPEHSFGPEDQRQAASIELGDASPSELAKTILYRLEPVANALALLRFSREIATAEFGQDLSITLDVCRRGEHHGAQTCSKTPDVIEHYGVTDAPILYDGDKVTLHIQNRTRQPIDLTLLIVDSQYGIQSLFPLSGESNRLQPNDRIDDLTLDINAETVGPEQLLFILAPGTGEMADFSFLAQQGLGRRGLETSGDISRATISDLFQDRRFGSHQLRGAKRALMPEIGAKIFAWRTSASERTGRRRPERE